MKTKLNENIEHFLTSPKGYKKSWIRSLLAMILVIVISAIVLGLILDYGPASSNNLYATTSLYKNLHEPSVAQFVHSSLILTYVSFGLLGVPFLMLFTFWIIGINQTSKSKFFHLFMWFVIFVALLIATVALVLFIRSAITNYNIYA